MAIDTNLQNLFKTLYPPGVPQNVVTRKRKWLKEIPKADDFDGKNMFIPVDYVNPQGRSATFVTAQTQASGGSSQSIGWTLTRATDYADVILSAETIRASRKDAGAFARMVKHESDMALDALSESAAIALYGSGTGSCGRIATSGGIAGAVITLSQKHDVKNFHKGNILQVSSGDGTGGTRTGTVTIASVQYGAGTITCTGNVTTGISLAVNGDYIYQNGDYNLKLAGLAGWLPLVAPTGGDSWFGTDRSVDPESLAGWRVNTPTLSIEENFLTLGELIAFGGGEPDLALINPTNYASLIKGLGSKVQYTAPGGTADIGFSGAVVHLSTGPVKVISDPECPGDRCYLLTSNTWLLHHLDEFPHVVMDDDNAMLRQSNADGVEIRFRYWANPACTAPRRNGVAQLV
jgi:hypothetical protein